MGRLPPSRFCPYHTLRLHISPLPSRHLWPHALNHIKAEYTGEQCGGAQSQKPYLFLPASYADDKTYHSRKTQNPYRHMRHNGK